MGERMKTFFEGKYYFLIVFIYLVCILIINVHIDIYIQNKILSGLAKFMESNSILENTIKENLTVGYLKNLSMSNNLLIILIVLSTPLLMIKQLKIYQRLLFFAIPTILFYFSPLLIPSH